ncbi:MAG: nicotinate-nucleotide adenylyltransferase [Microthrixaceae bacterium]
MARHRIGLLGGTFDPPHIGHLMVAVEARAMLNLEEVWLVVAHRPWQKSDRMVTEASRRLAMAAAAAADLTGVSASSIEFAAEGPTYTVDTLLRLAETHPEVAPTLILGADAAAGLDTWHRAAELSDLAELAVVDRPGAVSQPPVAMSHIGVPQLDVSSTDIRRRVATGAPFEVLCPPGVVSLIRGWSLYDTADGS